MQQTQYTPINLAGLDLGTVQVKLAIIAALDGEIQPLFLQSRPHHGHMSRAVKALFAEAVHVLGSDGLLCLGITGASAASFRVIEGRRSAIPEVNQLAAAVSGTQALIGNVGTILDLGGQFSTWIQVSSRPEHSEPVIEDFALNGHCAAGSGLFLEQQATRLQLTVEELGRLAANAKRGATIAGRCSVFAKSDMIHLQQKGTPVDEIAYGLCLALARTFLSSIPGGRLLNWPVAVIGGGGGNPGLIRAFREVLGGSPEELRVVDHFLYAGAIGAAMAAAHQPVALSTLVESVTEAESPGEKNNPGRPGLLHPLVRYPQGPHPSSSIAARPGGEAKNRVVHLGIDVGSVSTNVVLLTPQFEVLQSVYLPTAGQPVETLDRALAQIEEVQGNGLKVLSAGTTGSGRYLAARLIGADLVKNEITAQLTSAAHFFPEVETVIEIGGQDAKFINQRRGVLHDFAMNKICSAGTGSFLEEQADRLGVNIIDEFSELAFTGGAPVELGCRCTVFMDAELGNAIGSNLDRADLCAGLAYAVARNYLEKVAAGRKIGREIVFQGGTSANEAVVSAFAGLLGRPVKVHPFGKVSGAIGAALLSAAALAQEQGRQSRFAGFSACRAHAVTSFSCGKCENRCQVNRVTVGEKQVHFGDNCERYSVLDRGEVVTSASMAASTVEDLFAVRATLLENHLAKPKEYGRTRIGLIRSSLMLEYLPFWSHLLDQLGFTPVVVDAHSDSLTGDTADNHGLPPEVCLPLKLAGGEIGHLLTHQAVDSVLLPSVLELDQLHPGDRVHTCIYVQQLPHMVAQKYGDRLLIPELAIAEGGDLIREGSCVLADLLGVSVARVKRGWRAALARQQDFRKARILLGRRALANIDGPAAVVIGKPYNLHDPKANLGLARHLSRLGLPAFPMDLLPVDEEFLGAEHSMLPWVLSRNQLRALHVLQRHPHLYPIHVSNYGCGTDAFALPHLERLWGDRPRLFLQFDGHQGEAGLVTRLEAFADEIAGHRSAQAHVRAPVAPLQRNNREVTPQTRCLLPFTSEHVYAYAGMFQRAGMQAHILDPPDGESIRFGEKVTTGGECHPFTVIAGDMMKLLHSDRVREGDRFFIPGTRLPCLLSQYGDGLRHILADQGDNRLQIFDQHPGEAREMFGMTGLVDLYEGLTMIDYLIIAACHFRPYEKEIGSVDRALSDCCRMVGECLEKRSDTQVCLAECMARFAVLSRAAGGRPLVGVTGDLYTRISDTGNWNLFARLETMGCEVWPSPFFAAATDFELPQNSRRWRRRGRYGKAVATSFTAAVLKRRSTKLAAVLEPELRLRCVEPEQRVLQKYAEHYAGENSSHLIRTMIAKMVDFSRRNAKGVVNAIGLNCMAGTAASATIPSIRKDHGMIPIITMTSGAMESLNQKIQLETFVRQVHERG